MAGTSRKIVTLPDANWVSKEEIISNPEKANAEIEALLSDAREVPAIDLPADDQVTLPGGLVRNGRVIRTVTVKELTGEDEEAISRTIPVPGQLIGPAMYQNFVNRILKRGVMQVGDEPRSSTDELLRELLVGDREQVLLGIRKATYGDKIDIDGWTCSNCGNKADLSMDLSDIPVKTLHDPREEIIFDVPLRKGGTAQVKLADGEDTMALFEKDELTQAQRETILLSRCVLKIVTPAGLEQNVSAFKQLVLGMSVPDRHKIIDELRERQPGPKYDEIKYECESCGEGVNVAVGMGHLFPDFRWI